MFAAAIWIPYWAHGIAWHASLGAIVAWALSTFAGIKAGGSFAVVESRAGYGSAPALKVAPSARTQLLRAVALIAPYLFVVGLVALVSIGVHTLLRPSWSRNDPWDWETIADFPVASVTQPSVLLIGLMLFGMSLFMSWRIGVNEFSMHHFYRNRLVRCYLGASSWQARKADWFTGFDPDDDIRLTSFDSSANGAKTADRDRRAVPYWGPYPIVNAALNLVAGEDLAWQERKATSFVFTPKYCGYDVDRAVMQKHRGDDWPDGYAPTHHYVVDGCGPTLGTAMAISGAAASPNMGRLTSSASAFLMTVFNARLGWWLPNPRRKGWFGWDRSGPGLGINYTAIELFGLTDDKKKFVNLSDGGHFENLGVYELIRRGCRYVIVSDAGQDGSFGLEDLGNVVRKCRTDFGVEIEIGTDAIRDRNAKGWSSTHCVVGTIHYNGVPKSGVPLEPDATGRVPHEEGLLIYLKPSITGDEPFDVLEYDRRVPEFPHENTVNQWFNESQFESYRRLGGEVLRSL